MSAAKCKSLATAVSFFLSLGGIVLLASISGLAISGYTYVSKMNWLASWNIMLKINTNCVIACCYWAAVAYTNIYNMHSTYSMYSIHNGVLCTACILQKPKTLSKNTVNLTNPINLVHISNVSELVRQLLMQSISQITNNIWNVVCVARDCVQKLLGPFGQKFNSLVQDGLNLRMGGCSFGC